MFCFRGDDATAEVGKDGSGSRIDGCVPLVVPFKLKKSQLDLSGLIALVSYLL